MNERQNVLIVDDDPAIVVLLEALLEDTVDVNIATTGEKALEIVAETKIDLILLDVSMPGMDGYQLCEKLKSDSQTQTIPVIFITGKADQTDEAKGLSLGAIDYIAKPINAPIVRARVKNHLELKRYRDLLENQSHVDGLTGIANRRSFDERLSDEWKRCQREQCSISVILADIDFFKPYNDNYGHVAGDRCLQKVAQALQGIISRPADFVARYGGEEFVAILPSSDLEGALVVAERLCDAVRNEKIPHEHSQASDVVTMSFGVVSTIPGQDDSPTGLVERADECLYQAKETGRDKVVGQK